MQAFGFGERVRTTRVATCQSFHPGNHVHVVGQESEDDGQTVCDARTPG